MSVRRKIAYNGDLLYNDIAVAVDAVRKHMEARQMSDKDLVSRLRSIESMLGHLESITDYRKAERLVDELYRWIRLETGEDFMWVVTEWQRRGY